MKIKFYSFFVFLIIFYSCNKKQNKYEQVNINAIEYVDGYTGDNECKSCHTKEFDLWKSSHHDLAMQVANDSTVLGNFDDVKITIDGVAYFFY